LLITGDENERTGYKELTGTVNLMAKWLPFSQATVEGQESPLGENQTSAILNAFVHSANNLVELDESGEITDASLFTTR